MRCLALIRLLAWCLLPGLLPLCASAAAPAWRVAPREAWVQDPPKGTTLPLHDRQIRITAAGDERYEHSVLPLTREQTGEQASQLSLSLDPRFQLLVIHALKLTHAATGAKVFTAAQISELVRTQAAEADPHRLEWNPQLQISLQLPGVQAGDVLECEYTVQSLAARFPGVIAGHYAAQWLSGEQPLHWERLRVLWPPGRSLQYRVIPGAAAGTPQVQRDTGVLDIQWRDLVPIVAEPDTPGWFTPQNLVQLSDFADWTQVATLLAPQYGAAEPVAKDPPGAAATPAMILDALRLVQSKVHATNQSGSGPYLPADPAVLLQRGFGDSRDLARLLVSLLRRLGVDAQVALADSRRGALLDEALPSPYILNSALVLVHLGTSRYWINPTAAALAAELPTTDPADLRHALLIAASDGKVVLLPPPQADSQLRSVLQEFDLRAGNSQPAALTVTTRFHGLWAQAVRSDLLAQSRAQLQLTQIQAVAQDYPDASADGEVQLQDLPASQTLQLTARFHIPRPFGDSQDPHFSFFAEELADAVQPRDEATRRLPLGLPWPMQLEQHIAATLPRDLRVLPGSTVIRNPAFRYQRDVHFAAGKLDITHRYVALSDHVDPADYASFLAANAQVYQLLGLQIRPDETWWHLALNWLGEYWVQISATAVVLGTLTLASWRRLRPA